jgi:hypothetical protein
MEPLLLGQWDRGTRKEYGRFASLQLRIDDQSSHQCLATASRQYHQSPFRLVGQVPPDGEAAAESQLALVVIRCIGDGGPHTRRLIRAIAAALACIVHAGVYVAVVAA